MPAHSHPTSAAALSPEEPAGPAGPAGREQEPTDPVSLRLTVLNLLGEDGRIKQKAGQIVVTK